jgi:hypothetical protein
MCYLEGHNFLMQGPRVGSPYTNRFLKDPSSPFVNLRVNSVVLDMIQNLPFVLHPANHCYPSHNNLRTNRPANSFAFVQPRFRPC